MEFMRNLWAWTTRLEGLHNYMELMYTNLIILLLTSSKLSLNQYFISKDWQLNSKTFLNSTLNSLLNVNYEFKSYGSWYERSFNDKVGAWIQSSYSHTHLFKSWNKLLKVVEDSSKDSRDFLNNVWENSQDLTSRAIV